MGITAAPSPRDKAPQACRASLLPRDAHSPPGHTSITPAHRYLHSPCSPCPWCLHPVPSPSLLSLFSIPCPQLLFLSLAFHISHPCSLYPLPCPIWQHCPHLCPFLHLWYLPPFLSPASPMSLPCPVSLPSLPRALTPVPHLHPPSCCPSLVCIPASFYNPTFVPCPVSGPHLCLLFPSVPCPNAHPCPRF